HARSGSRAESRLKDMNPEPIDVIDEPRAYPRRQDGWAVGFGPAHCSTLCHGSRRPNERNRRERGGSFQEASARPDATFHSIKRFRVSHSHKTLSRVLTSS